MSSINFRIRTITAGINLKSIHDLDTFEKAIDFLAKGKKKFESFGYEVQTTRIALPHLTKIIGGSSLSIREMDRLKRLDDLCRPSQIMLAIGDPFLANSFDSKNLSIALKLIKETENISFHTAVASPDQGIHELSLRLAAEICHSLASATEGGEANFRYTVSANCPPGIPYFPTAYHHGHHAFGIGLESGNLFQLALKGAQWHDVQKHIIHSLSNAYEPIIKISNTLAQDHLMIFNGLDVSTAPGLDSSIGQALEQFTGSPFGAASTLAACAEITSALKSLPFKICGYSGIMLPVIEDTVLARRASEGLFTIRELLLFSTVCGTGLDVVPIPGDTSIDKLISIYRDMAALSMKYNTKPLSARLFPIPGKKAGEWARFDNPYLTDCKVMDV